MVDSNNTAGGEAAGDEHAGNRGDDIDFEDVEIDGANADADAAGEDVSPAEAMADAGDPSDVDTSHLEAHENGSLLGTDAAGEPVPDGPECTECGEPFDTEQAMKTHRGMVHPGWDDDDADDDVESDATGDDGDAAADGGAVLTGGPVDDDAMSLAERATAREESDRTVEDKWDAARDAFEMASISAADVTRRDAFGRVVVALEAETSWMSVKRRSDENHSDLWHWTDANGWSDDGFQYVQNRMVGELGTDADRRAVRKVVMQLATLNTVTEDELNAGEHESTLIPVANGVIDISEVEYDADSMTIDTDSVTLEPMEESHYFTYRVQTRWDAENADVDGLDEWIESVTMDAEDRRVLWEFAGHSLHPRYPADGFLVALGEGGSGKSQVFETVKAMLGDDNTTPLSIADIEANRFAGHHVVDARANVNTELTGTKLPSIDRLKTLSAGEEMHVEKKGVDGHFSRNDATMFFASDDPPAFPTSNDALGRRLYPIEFPMQFVDSPSGPYELQARPKLEVQAELQSDARLQAALVRSVEGLARLLNAGNFTAERTRSERVERYETFADPIVDFRRTCLVDASNDSEIESGVLKATFDAFAHARGHDGKTLRQITDIIDEMTGISFGKGRSRSWSDEQSKHTVYSGMRFSAEALREFVPEDALPLLDRSELETDDEDEVGWDEQVPIDDDFDGEHEYDGPMSIGEVITDTVEEMEDADGAPKRAAVIGRVAGEHNIDPDKVEHVAEKLMQKGALYEPAEDAWRAT